MSIYINDNGGATEKLSLKNVAIYAGWDCYKVPWKIVNSDGTAFEDPTLTNLMSYTANLKLVVDPPTDPLNPLIASASALEKHCRGEVMDSITSSNPLTFDPLDLKGTTASLSVQDREQGLLQL